MPHATTSGSTMIFDLAQPSSAGPSFPPYVFRKRNERVDWRKIAAVDPDRIAREVDFKTLQENINNITFCDVESELSGPDERPLDPNYIKLFKLAQMTIEYLLNCQQYLTGVIGERETQLEKLLKESSNVSVELDKDKKELERLKKECHKRKKLLAQQQQVLFAGGPGSYFKCPKCTKAFINESFLHGHLDRKHPEYRPKDDYDELQQQLAEMKAKYEEMKRQLEEANSGASELRKNAKANEESETNLRKMLESARVEDKENSQRQLDQFKSMFMDELKEVNDRFRQSQSELALEREKNAGRSRRGVGNRLFDEDELEQMADLVDKQKKEIDLLKNKLQERTGIDELQFQMSQMKSTHVMEIENLRRQFSGSENRRIPEEQPKSSFVDRNKNNQAFTPKPAPTRPEGKRTSARESGLKPKKAKWDEAAHESKMAEMRTRMLNDSNFMEEVREECLHSVGSQLVDFGVQHNNNNNPVMGEDQFSRINKNISHGHDQLSQKNPSFFQLRTALKDQLDQRFRTSVARRLTPTARPVEPEVQPKEIVKRIVQDKPNPHPGQADPSTTGNPNQRIGPNPTSTDGAVGGGGGGGVRSQPKMKENKRDNIIKREEEEATLPKGTIPFIAHAMPEMTTFGRTSMPMPAKRVTKNRTSNNLNFNNNNSNDNERGNNNNNNNNNDNGNNNNDDDDHNETDDVVKRNDVQSLNLNESGKGQDFSRGSTTPEAPLRRALKVEDDDDDDDDEDDSDDEEDDEEEEEEEEGVVEREKFEKDFPDPVSLGKSSRDPENEKTTPKAPPRSIGIRLPASGNDVDSVSEFDDDEDDDDEEDHATRKRPESSQPTASSSPNKSTPAPSGSPAMGQNVRKLRDKIQQQLGKRDVKKPAGGVDVGGDGGEGGRDEGGVGDGAASSGGNVSGANSSSKAPIPAPRSSRQRKSSSGWEDDDDDDDEDSFTVSSLEGQSHGRGALKMPPGSSFGGASSTLTSSGDGGAASTSHWGSGASGFGSSGGLRGGASSGGGARGGAAGGGGVRVPERKSVVDVVDWDSDY